MSVAPATAPRPTFHFRLKEEKKEEERAEAERKRRVEAGEEPSPEEMQREVDEKNKNSMMGWVSNKMSGLGLGGGDDAQKESTQGDKAKADRAKYRAEHDYYAGMNAGNGATKKA